MPISIVCTGCAKKLKVPDTAAGKKVRCPSCQAVNAIPEEEFETPDEEETSVTAEPPMPKKKQDNEVAVTTAPPASKKKPAWEAKGESDPEDDDDNYGIDEEDEEEREERRRRKRRRRRAEEDDERSVRRREAHRGVLILVLSIVALFGACLCAFIGWGVGGFVLNMANEDIEKIDRGVMDPDGRSMAVAGKVCAIIAIGLGLINAILGIALQLQNIK